MTAEPLKRRPTAQTIRVLKTMLEKPMDEHYGLDISRKTSLKSGSLYPILGRLEHRGWLTSRWEAIDPCQEGRPERRYYSFTHDGYLLAREAVMSKVKFEQTEIVYDG